MHRYYIVAILATFLNLSAAKADHLRDSIGVENLKGKKVILHQVVTKDTYYSISRRYNVPPKTIMTFNNDKYLSLGVVIKVPTDIPFSAPAQASNQPPVRNSTTVPANSNSQVAPSSEAQPSLIEHSVQRRENLNMLAEKYGTTVDEIKRVNNLRTINLQIGQVLKIPAKADLASQDSQPVVNPAQNQPTYPVTNPRTETARAEPARTGPARTVVTKPDTTKPDTTKPGTAPVPQQTQQAPLNRDRDQLVVHTVAGNETMYSIATKYSLTLDQLKAKNNLTTNSLYVGQKLLVSGQYPVKKDPSTFPLSTDTIDSIKNPSLRLPASRYGLSQVDEKGMGVYIMDPDLDPSKMLVLHRTAPLGTIMKITSPMSNRSTFAKVVGKFTENESTKDVIIVMTKAVADALGALDKRFLCNLTYSAEANEQ